MEGSDALGLNAVEMCLVPDVVIPTKFIVPYFEKYKGASDPRTHIWAYYWKMVAYSDDEQLHFFNFGVGVSLFLASELSIPLFPTLKLTITILFSASELNVYLFPISEWMYYFTPSLELNVYLSPASEMKVYLFSVSELNAYLFPTSELMYIFHL